MQSFLMKHQTTQVTQPPYSPDLAPFDFRPSQKLKSLLKGKRFQTIDEIQKNITGQLMVIRRTLWGPKGPTLKGTKASLSYVQCFLYLVSSSVNVSIFHSTWLDTLQTDFLHVHLLNGTSLTSLSTVEDRLFFHVLSVMGITIPIAKLERDRLRWEFIDV